MVKHSIASGDYGLRRREVEAGQEVLRNAYPNLRDLGDATLSQLQCCAALMIPGSPYICQLASSTRSSLGRRRRLPHKNYTPSGKS